MNKIIISCPNCSTKLRIPDKKHIKFKCSSCSQDIEYDGEEAMDVKEVEKKEFHPSNFRIGFHTIVGALIGAPIGAMLVACVASIYGSFAGLVSGFGASLGDGFLSFLVDSVDNIGNGAAKVACEWTIYGAKIGPWVFGVIGFLMAYLKWEDDIEEEKTNPDKPTGQ